MDDGLERDRFPGQTASGSGSPPLLDLLRPSPVPAGMKGKQARALRWGERGGRKVRLWASLRATASGKGVLAVADQAVVSGTSFLTTVLIGRWCGPGELGIYSLGVTLLVSWVCVQESLIAL